MKKQIGRNHRRIVALLTGAVLFVMLPTPEAALAQEAMAGAASEVGDSAATGPSEGASDTEDVTDDAGETGSDTEASGTGTTEPVEEAEDAENEVHSVSTHVTRPSGEGSVTGAEDAQEGASDTDISDDADAADISGEKVLREVLETPAHPMRDVIEVVDEETRDIPENVTSQIYETTPYMRETGNGQIVGNFPEELPEDVFSVALPILPEGFYDFTMDPQGLLQLTDEDGVYDGSTLYFDHHMINDGYSGTSDTVDIVNRSNIPVLLKVTLTVDNTVTAPVTFTPMDAVDEEGATNVGFGIVPLAAGTITEGEETPDIPVRDQMIEIDSNGFCTAIFYLPGSEEDFLEGIRTSAGFAITGACSRGDAWADFVRASQLNGENLKIHITYAVEKVTDAHKAAIESGILNIDPSTGMLMP